VFAVNEKCMVLVRHINVINITNIQFVRLIDLTMRFLKQRAKKINSDLLQRTLAHYCFELWFYSFMKVKAYGNMKIHYIMEYII